jgi:hypothetical protein
VFGIAIAAAVFAANGGYSSPAAFIHGFKPALLVSAALAASGLLAALLAPGRPRAETTPASPDLVKAGDPT